ncbi:MAG: pyroglutamyl-peptidase I [Elusimicrobia bacterium]|nr:pyroglutamyl-peptidase I [Elusimicrobiota bacterium]
MRVLVSGFEPFGGRKVNASWELARRLPGRLGAKEMMAVRLPVVYGKAWPLLIEAIAHFKPDAVVAVGECPGKAVRLERIAVNLRQGGTDNAGRKSAGAPILPHGRAAELSTLPLERIRVGTASLCAGTFLCNEVFYLLMSSGLRFPKGAGFVHVPQDAHRRLPGALRRVIAAL